MERIKEALERARKQREQNASTAGEPEKKHPDHAADGAISPASHSGIVYTQTQQVKTEDELAAENRVILQSSKDPVCMAYDMLRTQVLQRLQANNWNTLAVTSPDIGAGKTLTAVNLAMSLAREVNNTVLLVDLDLRNPGVHKCLGYETEKGLSDYLLSDVPLPEIFVNPGLERLVILPGREPVMHSAEMLSSPKMVALVEELKNRYPSRLVLFDMPPMLSSDDMLAFSPNIDAVLMVMKEGATQRKDVLRAMELLGNTPVIGTVLNKSEDPVSAAY